MFLWFINRVFRGGARSRRGVAPMHNLENLARSGMVAWLLAQERARLDFLAAKEAYCSEGSWLTLVRMLRQLLQLNCTNAVVHGLLNEQAIERLLAHQRQECSGRESLAVRKPA
jgi:hypothetical protein